MIELPNYRKPECFPNMKLYDEWKDCARVAQEPCTICDDCTPKFQFVMRESKKCYMPVWVNHKFGVKTK